MKTYAGDDRVRFVVLYQREPHARQMGFKDIVQPSEYAERVALARRTREELRLDVEVWVDDMGDASRAAFGDVPNAGIVIDPRGRVREKLAWCEPEPLQKALTSLLRQDAKARAGKPAARRAEDGFLAAVQRAGAKIPGTDPVEAKRQRHHRQVMLAHLLRSKPKHPQRSEWRAELQRDGAPPVRAWLAGLVLDKRRD